MAVKFPPVKDHHYLHGALSGLSSGVFVALHEGACCVVILVLLEAVCGVYHHHGQ